jgi:AraC family transcriptional regulator, regulatory protein of adaptative response / methylated-DNA-[protein]-cysteine methyltransferase
VDPVPNHEQEPSVAAQPASTHAVITSATERAWLRDYDRIAAAIAWIDAHQRDQPRLADVAAAQHLSPAHLQRTFSRFAGTSPTRLLRWLTADAARRALRERATVLEAVTTSGVSSGGRLHDLTVTVDAVTPGELASGGDGLTLRVGIHATPLGSALVAESTRGVVTLRFLDAGTEVAVAELAREWPAATLVRDDTAGTAAVAHLAAVLDDGARDRPPLAVAAVGTNLQLRVWAALLHLSEGEVTTYTEVARAAGSPSAVRAAASAVGRNPVAALIPCHRVLRANGALGGYRWGLTRKRALLAREAARTEERAEGRAG